MPSSPEWLEEVYEKVVKSHIFYCDKFDCEVKQDNHVLKVQMKFYNPSPALREIIEKSNL